MGDFYMMTKNAGERVSGFGFLSGNMIKILAAVLMVIDHIGVVLGHEDSILRILGRISMPLFAFMIAEGAKYTKNRAKYLGLIGGLALVCQLVYYFALNDTYMCILVTFSISILLIYALDFLKWAYLSERGNLFSKIFAPILFFGLIYLTYFATTKLTIDYGFYGIMMPVFASLTDMRGYKISEKIQWIDTRPVRIFSMCIPMFLRMFDGSHHSIVWYSFIAIPILLLYSGKRGKLKMKYFFYIFYPLHLVLLYGILILIMLINR